MKKAKRSAKKKLSIVESIPTEKYLTFLIDRQLYALPTAEIVEIIRMQPITFMPKLPDYVKGVINLRGKIVPLIDMRLKFDKEAVPYDSRTSIVIVEKGEMTAGLIVDAVKDVRDVEKAQIFEAPGYKKTVGGSYVRSIASMGEESAMLLNLERVLSEKDANEALTGRPAGEPALKTAAE